MSLMNGDSQTRTSAIDWRVFWLLLGAGVVGLLFLFCGRIAAESGTFCLFALPFRNHIDSFPEPEATITPQRITMKSATNTR